jgi:ABC-2 type transport system permease protein
MQKYLAVFQISFAQEFVYRMNFIMWRVRNILQIFLLFFLWDAIFADPQRVVFGYDRAKILTYVFGLLFLRSLVLSSRSVDVAGEIARGDLTNYLLKPINYFKYWFTRDLSSKALNLVFAFLEAGLIYVLLKPPFFLQTNFLLLALFFLSAFLAVVIYFLLLFVFSSLPFWFPEQAWGSVFLLFIFTDFLGGGAFPLDILPASIQQVLYLTPFPYLLFMPLQIYLGKLSLLASFKAVALALVWAGILAFALQRLWNWGLKNYRAEGR